MTQSLVTVSSFLKCWSGALGILNTLYHPQKPHASTSSLSGRDRMNGYRWWYLQQQLTFYCALTLWPDTKLNVFHQLSHLSLITSHEIGLCGGDGPTDLAHWLLWVACLWSHARMAIPDPLRSGSTPWPMLANELWAELMGTTSWLSINFGTIPSGRLFPLLRWPVIIYTVASP